MSSSSERWSEGKQSAGTLFVPISLLAVKVYTRPDHTCSRYPDKINYGIQVPDFFCNVLVAAAFDIWVRFFTQGSAETVLVAPGNGQKLLFHIIDEIALF